MLKLNETVINYILSLDTNELRVLALDYVQMNPDHSIEKLKQVVESGND